MKQEIHPGIAKLRETFPQDQIDSMCRPTKRDNPKGNCEKCGGYHGLPAIQLYYVGHAALTDRLLEADPFWTWEPVALGADGYPAIDKDGGMWIRLTVCGVTRLGYGDAQGKTGGDATKERIGDALRNAAMRFGAAIDLWKKGNLPDPTKKEPPQYTEAQIEKNISAWKKAVESEKATPESIIAKVSSSYRLSPEQVERILALNSADPFVAGMEAAE